MANHSLTEICKQACWIGKIHCSLTAQLKSTRDQAFHYVICSVTFILPKSSCVGIQYKTCREIKGLDGYAPNQ